MTQRWTQFFAPYAKATNFPIHFGVRHRLFPLLCHSLVQATPPPHLKLLGHQFVPHRNGGDVDGLHIGGNLPINCGVLVSIFDLCPLIIVNETQHCLEPQARDKFIPIDSPLMPERIPIWVDALQAVVRDPLLIVQANGPQPDDGKLLFPDPTIFVGAGANRQARYFATWAAIREPCLYRMFSTTSVVKGLSTQEWRDFLGVSKKFKQVLLPIVFGHLLDDFGVSWNSLEALPPSPMSDISLVQRILWELTEYNFRFEFLALDRRACRPDRRMGERDTSIRVCFPRDINEKASAFLFDHTHANRGLADRDAGERLPFLVAFREVIRDWAIERPPILDEWVLTSYTPEYFFALEQALARTYCQTFFNYFGRAATVPYHLSMSPSGAT